jgi:8-oxo-dGTP pyrophosphatase MutT (NUDIX family)
MTDMVWKPHVTVAAVVERNGEFLLIEERASGRIVVNQPAGHLEDGETLIAAVVRETLEETGWTFEPEAVVGIYLWRPPQTRRTFLRVAFCGPAIAHDATRALDHGIVGVRWLARGELAALGPRLRSPLVLRCVDDYLARTRYPLELLTHLISEFKPSLAANA